MGKEIEVKTCSFGTLSTFKLKMELNVGLAVAAGPINKKLSALVIPSNILGIFELSDLVVGYYDGFLMAGATPTFLAPKYRRFVQVSDAFPYEGDTCTGPHESCCPAPL